jgi:hypothetical protein
MTALNRNPQNTNFLQPTKFLLTFNRVGALQYFCQSVNLPGISLDDAERPTPFVNLYSPGTKLTYNPLNVTFIVDEDLITWQNLQQWLNSIASPEGFQGRNGKPSDNFSDATLTILTNLNNSNLRIQYYNVFPTSISDIDFDTKLSADDIITASASFRYDYYEILTA